jgi:hypothetical protein
MIAISVMTGMTITCSSVRRETTAYGSTSASTTMP